MLLVVNMEKELLQCPPRLGQLEGLQEYQLHSTRRHLEIVECRGQLGCWRERGEYTVDME